MKLLIIREQTVSLPNAESFTPGRMYADGLFFCFTCEDEVRKEKIYRRTAIPAGRYPVEVSYSHKFGKLLPAVLDVPGFSGIRIHGGNRAEDSLGCVLVGKVRTATGIAQCADTVRRLIALIQSCEDNNVDVTLEIK